MPPATPRNRSDTGEPAERWPAKLVGGRLREARRARGLTLDGVAASAGFTKSFVSAVERGETSPSIGSLYAICNALGLAMSALFEAADAPESSVVRRADVEGAYFGGEGVVNYRAVAAGRAARAGDRDAHRTGRVTGHRALVARRGARHRER